MDNIDNEIRHALKSWVNQYPLPPGGRTRLINSATAEREQAGKKSSLSIGVNPNDLISWAMVYCVDKRTSIVRLVA